MKKLFRFLICLILCLGLILGAASVTGIRSVGDLLARLPEPFGSMLGNAAQIAIDQGTNLVVQLADHIQPSGEGGLQQGELPEDRLGAENERHSFSKELYPYREMLSESGKTAYDQIYSNAAAVYDEFPLHTPVPLDSIAEVMSAVFYDHPELFWVETSYQYTYNSRNEVVSVTLKFNEAAGDLDAYQSRYNQVVGRIVSEARQLATAVEQEKYVHDYLLDNVTYQLSAPMNQSSYSALVNGGSVCAGYARAFQHVLLELGIPCYYCTGYAGDAHAWNIVKLDDDYYNVDVAWNDPLGNESGKRYYNYFNITDAEIFKDHSRSDMSVGLPAANGTKYSYANAFSEEAGSGENLFNTVKTPEEIGFSREYAITTLDGYYAYCEQKLRELGTGTHTFTMVISDRQLIDLIFDELDSEQSVSRYAKPVADDLGLWGYSASVSVQAESLSDGYWLLTQQIEFSSRSGFGFGSGEEERAAE